MQFGQDQSKPIFYHNFYVSKVDMPTGYQYHDDAMVVKAFIKIRNPNTDINFFGYISLLISRIPSSSQFNDLLYYSIKEAVPNLF